MANNASDTPKPLDIVLLTPTLDGGVGRVVTALARGMHELNLSIMIWTLSGGIYEHEAKKWATIQPLPTAHARNLVIPLIKLMRIHKPRTILSISFHINCLAVVARFLSRAPITLFLSEHTALDTGLGTLSVLKRFLAILCIRMFYRHADGLIAVSHGVAKHITKYAGVTSDQITVIYNPVLTPEMKRLSDEQVTHPFFEKKEPIILAVGRLAIEKDYPTLLDAFQRVRETTPAHLIIIGDGPDRQSIEVTIKTSGLSEYVSLLGSIANPYPYFVRSNVYVLSSLREGLPTTLIEALALGTPIVSTDIESGPREILHNGKYGTLVPARDGAALAEAIITKIRSAREQIPTSIIEPYQLQNAVHTYVRILFPGQF